MSITSNLKVKVQKVPLHTICFGYFIMIHVECIEKVSKLKHGPWNLNNYAINRGGVYEKEIFM